MPRKGVTRPSVRPRGGVAKVELFPAPSWTGAVSASANPWIFTEDRATYTRQSMEHTLTRHTLVMTFPSTADTRAAIARLVGQPLVARLTLASGEIVVVGHSDRFGASYPLRLIDTAVTSGTSPADLPNVTVMLEAIY